jgi:hypothetical protein
MAYYYRPHYGGFHGFGRRWNWGSHGWGRGWGQHGWGHHGWGRGFGRPAWGRRWPWLHADAGADQAALQSFAQNCLAQLFGPEAAQNLPQAIQQFQTQQQLPVTGTLDGNTMNALQAACAQQAGGQDAGGQGAPPPGTGGEMGEGEEYFLPQGTVLPGRKSWPHPFAPWGPGDERTFKQEIAKGVRDVYKLADAVFYARHPEWRGKRLPGGPSTPDIEILKEEWNFLASMVEAKTPGALIDVQPLTGGPQPEMEQFYDGHEPGMLRHSGRWVRHNGKIVVHL